MTTISLQTEFAFTLPLGYQGTDGELHREGRIRRSTARDEILPLRDPRVRENEAYLTVLLLSRVITQLGTLSSIHPGIIEGLFAPDIAFLQELYRRVNREGHTHAIVNCPSCGSEYAVDLAGGPPGES
jgi:hypothetical protein